MYYTDLIITVYILYKINILIMLNLAQIIYLFYHKCIKNNENNIHNDYIF